jgi:hypothetical protein
MDDVRFPIGPFIPNYNQSIEKRNRLINQLPEIIILLKSILSSMSADQLLVPYRPDGWSAQQIVHHLADNDMNAYLRFKRALTEEEPLAASYREDLFAELHDYKNIPVALSLSLLEALHGRFYILLNELHADDFTRTLTTQVMGTITLDIALQRFIWHNNHHISQIKALITSKGW